MTGSARAAAAVLFDMDGLLVDTEPVWTVAEEELAGRLGGRWSTELKAAIVGTRLDVAIPTILRWYGVEDTPERVGEASGWLLARMVELFHENTPVHSGAVELVDAVRAAGVATALVSSSYRVLVDAVLDRIGHERFDVTLAGDEVTHGKPHPEPYVTACARLGVSPRHCVVLEDAPSGVASGEAAGCVVVAVPEAAPVAPTPRRPVFEALRDIDVDWLLGLPATR